MSILSTNPTSSPHHGLPGSTTGWLPPRRGRARRATALRAVPAPAAPVDVVLAGGTDVVLDGPAHSPFAPSESGRRPVGVRPPRVSVVIPTYNEAKNLPHVMGKLPADLHEVILVDGHSVDGTVEVARSLRSDVRVVMQNRRGKGNAMACGFAAATGDVIVMLDADGSADPDEIPLFVQALVDGADFAKGSRFARGGGSDDITQTRAWGNRWLNRIANVLFGTEYTDLCYGYNAFWRYCLEDLELDPRPALQGDKLWGDGFEIETIINTRMAKARMKITEVPSFEKQRIFGDTNLNTWRDGTRVLVALGVERVNGKARSRRGRRGPGRVVFEDNHVVDHVVPGPALRVDGEESVEAV
jgi:Glycosyl transferase family 2